MARLALFLGSFFTTVFAWLAPYIGSRFAIVATVVTVSLSMVAALFVAAKSLVVGVVSLVPYEPFVMAFFACWPSNAETCIAACFGVDMVVFLYKYKTRLVALVTK